MLQQITLFFLLLSTTLNLFAQTTIQGVVMDQTTNAPIKFVNIGVLENANGTVSSENGTFELNLKDIDQNIQFSCIGYQSRTFSKEALAKTEKVYLQAVNYDISTIKVQAKRFKKRRKRGKKILTKMNTIAWGSSEFIGLEIGVPIKIEKESFLNSVHFGVLKSSTGNTLLRINIYDFKNGKVGANRMPENVFVYAKDLINYGKIDLSHLNLVVDTDVLVAIEVVKRDETLKEPFFLKFGVGIRFKGNIYTRKASQAIFEKEKANDNMKIGAFLKVKEVK